MTAVQQSSRIELAQLIDQRGVGGFQARIVALCAFAALLDGYDIQAMALAVPGLADDFHLSRVAFTPAVLGSLFGMALGSMLLAPFADRLGRRPLLIGFMVLIGLSSLASVLASGVYSLAFWRLLTGLGLGASVPVATALISEYAPRRHRAAMITLVTCSMALGSMAASFIAPVLDARWGWRGIFAAGGILPLLAAALLWLGLPESLGLLLSRRPGDRRIAGLIGRLAPGIDPAIVYAAPVQAGRKAPVLALFARQYRARTILLWAVFWMNLLVNYAVVSWLPSLLRSAGWAQDAALRAGSLVALGGLVGGLSLSWLADRGRPVWVLCGAYIGAAVALGLFLVIPSSTLAWSLLLALVGAGAFGAQFTIGALAASFYPPVIRATGLGWASAAGRAGSIVGPTFVALVMARDLPTSAVLGVMTVPMLICAAAVTLLPFVLKDRDAAPAAN